MKDDKVRMYKLGKTREHEEQKEPENKATALSLSLSPE